MLPWDDGVWRHWDRSLAPREAKGTLVKVDEFNGMEFFSNGMTGYGEIRKNGGVISRGGGCYISSQWRKAKAGCAYENSEFHEA